jgi:branched-chain amino acid transport system ATP-binding protein
MTMRLEVRDLAVSYGKVRALRGASLAVEHGQIVAIVGSNGAGKSTLLKAVMGLLPIGAGSIRFGDLDIGRASSPDVVRAGIAISPENRRLFPEMEVEENLRLGAYQVSSRHASETLEQVYGWFPILRERRRQLAGSLSGGQQQMVAIGRALMARPRLLLLDEPSLGLSPIMVQDIVRIVRRIHEAGIAVMLVEQNARLALKLCDRGYVLQTGVVTMTGTGSELLAHEGVQRSYLGM